MILTGKTEVLDEKSVQLRPFPPKTSHRLSSNRTQTGTKIKEEETRVMQRESLYLLLVGEEKLKSLLYCKVPGSAHTPF